jgi:hypothetical protein
MLRAGGAALRAAARARAPRGPPRDGAVALPPLPHGRACSAAAAAAAAAATPQGLASLWALKRLALATATGSAAAAVALSLQPPAYVLPPAAAASLAAQQPCTLAELVPRGAALLLLFSPLAALAPLVYACGAALPALRRAWYALLTWSLGAAGCAFIKWGQWAATRPDLFPPDMVNVLRPFALAWGFACARACALRSLALR